MKYLATAIIAFVAGSLYASMPPPSKPVIHERGMRIATLDELIMTTDEGRLSIKATGDGLRVERLVRNHQSGELDHEGTAVIRFTKTDD